MKSKKKALGRGLEAILQSPDTDITSKDISGNYVVGAIAELKIEQIEANPFQPRSIFDENELAELSASIKEQGIVQPLTVRKMGFESYQLIAGERRLRAAKLAGLKSVPCFIRVANDEQMLEMALIENIHRKDLNAIDIAISYQRLMEECKLTQEELSDKVGKKRATVSNYIRLLRLPAKVQLALKDDQITMGHARAIINIEDHDIQLKLMQRIISKGLSVRQIEKEVAGMLKNEGRPKTRKAVPEKFLEAGSVLSKELDATVTVKVNNKGKGSIVIPFTSEEDFDQVYSKLVKD
jgi:ParB family chromosome partitioning protein